MQKLTEVLVINERSFCVRVADWIRIIDQDFEALQPFFAFCTGFTNVFNEVFLLKKIS